MNRKLHVLGMWLSRLLLVGVGMFGGTLLAQSPSDQTKPAAQQQSDKDKKPSATAKQEDARHQPDLGVAVDSGRKSDALSTWITTEHNDGELAGPYIIKQSAEFGGRITDFTGNT